jgi:ABC-type nitrate/sulfonate/bicarbonate transport system substrate-binding protein
MDDLRMERALPDLYDDAKHELVRGYIKADQHVYGFARHHGIATPDAWRLIAREASARGDEAVRYLSENPLEERSDDRRAVEHYVRRAIDGAFDYVGQVAERLRHRRPPL